MSTSLEPRMTSQVAEPRMTSRVARSRMTPLVAPCTKPIQAYPSVNLLVTTSATIIFYSNFMMTTSVTIIFFSDFMNNSCDMDLN